MTTRTFVVFLLVFAAFPAAQAQPVDQDAARACAAIPSAGGPTAEQARACGRVADASVLQRLVDSGSAALVREYGQGLSHERAIAPAVEEVVVAHFADARVGAELRFLAWPYRSRALFELHRVRVEQAYLLAEPSVGQILRTEQPGIEADLLRLAHKFPKVHGTDPYTAFVARRRHAAAIPNLLAALPDSQVDWPHSPHSHVLQMLLAYPSASVWRDTRAELDRLRKNGRLSDDRHRAMRDAVDAQIAEAPAKLALAERRAAGERYMARLRELPVDRARLDALKLTNPAAYVVEEERVAEASEVIANEEGIVHLAPAAARSWLLLGLHARFKARDSQAALRHFGKAAQYGSQMALIAAADTLQFGIGDRNGAVAAYERALVAVRTSTGGPHSFVFDRQGSPANAWWQAWIQAEIAWLRHGRRFHGAVTETELAGFFSVMLDKTVEVTAAFMPEFRPPNTRHTTDSRGNRISAWQTARDQMYSIGRPTLKARLDSLPDSHIALMLSVRHASGLDDPDAMLAYIARNDPSGYWSVCALGTVAHLDSLGAAMQDEATRNEAVELLPGLTVEAQPRPLSVAARRFMEDRGFEVRSARSVK